MDVKVDSRLIRLERQKRAWTQEHLAKASGLALRTIQRIEKTGAASFESVRALAAVFGLSVADLRDSAANAEKRYLPPWARLSGLPFRLLLAIVSGVGCALAVDSPLGPFPFSGSPYVGFGLGGLLFGTSVLWPYLKLGRGVAWRAIALIAASSLSYFCAVWTALDVPPSWLGASSEESPQAFVLASAVGASIVLAAARVLVPIRTTAAYWVLGAPASVLGGLAMYAGAVLSNGQLGTIGGFVSWHVVMCLAIHFGGETNAVGRRIAAMLVSKKTAPRSTPTQLLQAGYCEV